MDAVEDAYQPDRQQLPAGTQKQSGLPLDQADSPKPRSYGLSLILYGQKDRRFRRGLYANIFKIRGRLDYQRILTLTLLDFKRLVISYKNPTWGQIVILLTYTLDLISRSDWMQSELIRFTFIKFILHHVKPRYFYNICFIIAEAMALHHPTGMLRL